MHAPLVLFLISMVDTTIGPMASRHPGLRPHTISLIAEWNRKLEQLNCFSCWSAWLGISVWLRQGEDQRDELIRAPKT